jgi:myo-inositol 2-dehydrogenase/D-chiro-inositol 1-dehydrogenase
MPRTRVFLIGAGFIADIHAECYHRFVPDAEIVGVYSRSGDHARAFAQKHGILHWSVNLEDALTRHDYEVADICLPNHLHAKTTIAAAAAGKHVILEKPLCLTIEEADEMIAACATHNRKLMYAEELCFAPKYERVRQLVREGALGDVYYLRHCEKHSGPHSDWFYDLQQSGGGALMDMGCHGFAWFRWMLRDKQPVSVYSHMQRALLHGRRTQCEETALSIVEFEGGAVGIVENSWAKLGGMEDRVEVCGTGGVMFADLFMGNSALTYSEQGYGYAMEKAGSTQGWTFTNVEEAFNQGYPQELQHFIACVRNDTTPITTGEDGRAVLEMLNAAYYSARTGERIQLPFRRRASKPIDLWLGSNA